MSAIWGEICRTKQVDKDDESLAKESLQKYRFDRLDSIVEKNLLFGCGHQYVTKEAEFEQLPYKEDELFYTADVMLDNRDELIKELRLPKEMPDGAILLAAFKKWKEKMVDHLLGVFSAVFYDRREDVVWIFTDHTGSRCIHYCIDDDGVYFSTTIDPILKLRNQPTTLCEKWMAACASNCSPDLYLYDGLTPFEDVIQLEAGHYLKIKRGKVEKIQYWNPCGLPKLKVSDEEALELFRQTFFQCVQDVMRSSAETGVTLSSGLDSSSVACVAAKKLKQEKKCLHSYTSIPLKEFQYDTDSFAVPDESPGVRKLAEAVDNLKPNFLECREKNCITDLKELVPILECPYKSGINLVYISDMYKKAREDGCRLMLKGQYGNGTISYGTVLTTMYQLFLSGHMIRAYKELKAFGKEKNVARRTLLKGAVAKYKSIYRHQFEYPENSLLREDLIKKSKIYEQMLKLDQEEGGGGMDNDKRRKGFLFSNRILQHLASFDTRLGLANGIIIRDPTKDKRIIELCMQLPITAFASEGIERRLVRKGMRGIVPDEILDDWMHRGRQGADFMLRMQGCWSQVKDQVMEYLANPRLKEYLSMEKVDAVRESLNAGINEDMDTECVEMLTICSISQFLELY